VQVIGVKPIAQLLEIDMKRLLFCAAAVCLMVLPGCASTGESRYTNDAKFVVDQDYVNAVNSASRRMGVRVTWVNPPTIRVEKGDIRD
jgi:hypothetical protein